MAFVIVSLFIGVFMENFSNVGAEDDAKVVPASAPL